MKTLRNSFGIAVMVGGVLVAGGLATAANKDDHEAKVLPRQVERSYPDHPVSAAELWTETKDAISCLEANGLATFGPVPSKAGSNLIYSFQVSPETAAVSEKCQAKSEGVARRFALDNSRPAETKPTTSLDSNARREKYLADHADPVTDEAARLANVRTDLEQCLAASGVAIDHAKDTRDPVGPLQKAAMSNRALFKECVSKVAPH